MQHHPSMACNVFDFMFVLYVEATQPSRANGKFYEMISLGRGEDPKLIGRWRKLPELRGYFFDRSFEDL